MNNFFVIGNPIKHSSSPMLFQYIFKKLDIDASYSSKLVTNEHLEKTLMKFKSNNVSGINITMPLKSKIIGFVDQIEKNASITKSINCLHFKDDIIKGYNNDYYGFNKLLKTNKLKLEASNNIILGSGGSTRTVVLSLIKHKVKSIQILSRNKGAAIQIINDFQPNLKGTSLKIFEEKLEFKNYNLINCTPITLLENSDISILSKIPKINYKILIDINYKIKNDFLNFSANKTVDGKSMFIYQALKSLDIWFESNISNKLDYKQLEKLLC
tara:strand:+ start:17 stop:826 length:810 start_codon:yes stop_codon:yes gene_type:complete